MSKKRINLFLDLDNTLINSLTPREAKNLSKNREKNFTHIDMDKSYRVFLRPHLQEFLDYIFDNFNVNVWTAASSAYASFIIENIILSKPNRKLDLVLFSYHCSYSRKYHKCTKDIRMLWNELKLKGYNIDSTYILDDLPEIYNTIPKHTIKAKYFDVLEPNSENDTFLLDTIKKLEDIKRKI
jgi:TFIIF-interacting CTD phosphatase-like protein